MQDKISRNRGIILICGVIVWACTSFPSLWGVFHADATAYGITCDGFSAGAFLCRKNKPHHRYRRRCTGCYPGGNTGYRHFKTERRLILKEREYPSLFYTKINCEKFR